MRSPRSGEALGSGWSGRGDVSGRGGDRPDRPRGGARDAGENRQGDARRGRWQERDQGRYEDRSDTRGGRRGDERRQGGGSRPDRSGDRRSDAPERGGRDRDGRTPGVGDRRARGGFRGGSEERRGDDRRGAGRPAGGRDARDDRRRGADRGEGGTGSGWRDDRGRPGRPARGGPAGDRGGAAGSGERRGGRRPDEQGGTRGTGARGGSAAGGRPERREAPGRRAPREQYSDRSGDRSGDRRSDRYGTADRRGRARDDRPAGRGEERRRTGAADRPAESTAAGKTPEPPLTDDITATGLDAEVRRDLRGLQRDTAESVARHLVAAGMLVDSDPALALEHARFARTRASRIAVVREAAGIAAYHAGEWAEALSELRAARRMGGGTGHLAVMADIERALGRPERALELSRGPEVRSLDRAEGIELAIVAAGARRDLGELDAAVVSLQIPELDPARREPWSARLFYAYADNLLAVGRESEALQWFVHAADADEAGETGADVRIAELTGEPLPEEDIAFLVDEAVNTEDAEPGADDPTVDAPDAADAGVPEATQADMAPDATDSGRADE